MNLPRPWPTPPRSASFRDEAFVCHNCGTEEGTLGVGTWMQSAGRNKLILCVECFEALSKTITTSIKMPIWQFEFWRGALREFLRKRKENV